MHERSTLNWVKSVYHLSAVGSRGDMLLVEKMTQKSVMAAF